MTFPAGNDRPQRRRNLRLDAYDYALPGAYFITVCTAARACTLGHVADGAVVLNDVGLIVRDTWIASPAHYPGVAIDEFVVMPNHIHGIVVLSGQGTPHAPSTAGSVRGPTPTVGLPEIVRRFKTLSTARTSRCVPAAVWDTLHGHLWQRNYYEHVIRSDDSLHAIREYIVNNPMQWDLDEENPGRRRGGHGTA
ncbi:MAG: transposase [Dehalococcoidia bacterium]|jgi:REP element-mobilizing transposase RayT|nr:transposase [Dehalococcoidia bacterium]